MQNKLMNLVVTMLIILCLTALTGASAGDDKASDVDFGPAEIILRSPATIKSVKFPHRQHQDRLACSQCHHSKSAAGIKIQYTEGMQIQKCVVCHNKEKMISPKLNSFKLVAHNLCKECHKKYKNTAPTKCSGCHIE